MLKQGVSVLLNAVYMHPVNVDVGVCCTVVGFRLVKLI